MRQRRQLDRNPVPRPNHPTATHQRHNASLPDHLTIRPAPKHRRQQPALKPLDLSTRIPQSRHLQHHLPANPQQTTARQSKQIDAPGRNILAHIPRRYLKPLLPNLRKQLAMDQIHLPQIRLARIRRHPRAMLHPNPQVSIPLNAKPGQNRNCLNQNLGKPMLPIPSHSHHHTPKTGHRHPTRPKAVNTTRRPRE